MEKKSKLLTIGQFAALHGINKKTLMWYDEIGLFKPAATADNGYRCYSYHQSPVLETILLLRELDVSLTEIQEFMKNRSAENMKRLLDERIADLDAQIMHLNAVRKTLHNHCQDMDTLLSIDLSEISIMEKKERHLVTVEIDQDISFEKEVELITAETTRYGLGRLHDASYGSMLPVSSLLEGNFDNYTRLFIEIPFFEIPASSSGGESGLYVQPAGSYIRAFHKGSLYKLPARYQEIIAYARTHGLNPYGFSFEKGINETVIDRIEDYIVQIEIPVR